MNKKTLIILSGIFLMNGIVQAKKTKNKKMDQVSLVMLQSPQEVVSLFNHTAESLETLKKKFLEEFKQKIDCFLAIPDKERNFENSFGLFDTLTSSKSNWIILMSAALTLDNVTMDPDLRIAAQKVVQEVSAAVREFSMDERVYKICKLYSKKLNEIACLSDEQHYFIQNTMEYFDRSGFNKDQETRNQLKEIEKEITVLYQEFLKNIASEQTVLSVDIDKLSGLESNFINQFIDKKDQTKVNLPIQPDVVRVVLANCDSVDVRKDIFGLYAKRGYPANKEVLQKMLLLRQKKADILGFKNYAHYQLVENMAESFEAVDSFLDDMLVQVIKKSQEEVDILQQLFPDLVVDGKIDQWSREYLLEKFRQKKYNIKEGEVAEYFPLEHTIQQLFKLYEDFLSIELKEVSAKGLWHSDVRVVEVYDKVTKELQGYFLLDLHPRKDKFTHACAIKIVPATYCQGKETKVVGVIITNFPKGIEDKPSLLKLSDVKTFFHEFGHALHYVLGRQELATFSGANVKRDFVEMPSQMLERWLDQKEILKKISAHYKTKKPLPDDMIENIIQSKNCGIGMFLQNQISYAKISLAYHQSSAVDMSKVLCEIANRCSTLINFHENWQYFYASFGHLASGGYAASYYGYLWSSVFAADLFEKIKQEGLLDPDVGMKYRNLILKPGGSKNPSLMLEEFLQRKPNNKAFFSSIKM